MNKKVLSVLLSFILVFCGVLFVGCDEDDITGSGSSGSSGFYSKFFDGVKVVYSRSMVADDNGIEEFADTFYRELILDNIDGLYGSGLKNENLVSFFPDSIRQTIVQDINGNAQVLDDAPVWLWTLDPNAQDAPVDEIQDLINNSTFNDFLDNFELYKPYYPSFSDTYSTALQIVLYETMLGYPKTTFVVNSHYDVLVETCHRTTLIGKSITDPEIANYLDMIKTQYCTTATYKGLTKADADTFITYILNNVIGEDVVAYDYETFGPSGQDNYRRPASSEGSYNFVDNNYDYFNYRWYVGRVANMVYSAIYDGSDEFVYTYKTKNNDEITFDFLEYHAEDEIGNFADLNEKLKNDAEYRPISVSYLRDYSKDMFFPSSLFDSTGETIEGVTSLEKSPLSEYQSVVLMPAAQKNNQPFSIFGLTLSIFSQNVDLKINIGVRYWAYDKESQSGSLYVWKQDNFTFYHSTPYNSAYPEMSTSKQTYVPGKGYLYLAQEKDNKGNIINGYIMDGWEINLNPSEVKEKKFVVKDNYGENTLLLDTFDNFDEIKVKSDAVNGIAEDKLNEGYAYKVVPSENGFGGYAVLDEEQVNFTFLELTFDVQKDPLLENQNYDYKVAIDSIW